MKIKRRICCLCSSSQPSSKCHMCLFFSSLLVLGAGSARRERCALRVRGVWTSVIHLRGPTLFVSAALAAVGGSEEVRSQSQFKFSFCRNTLPPPLHIHTWKLPSKTTVWSAGHRWLLNVWPQNCSHSSPPWFSLKPRDWTDNLLAAHVFFLCHCCFNGVWILWRGREAVEFNVVTAGW